MGVSSNSFVIGGNLTKSGKPILFGDPHVENFYPAFLYIWAIKFEKTVLQGAHFIGAPIFALGRNNISSWASTFGGQ